MALRISGGFLKGGTIPVYGGKPSRFMIFDPFDFAQDKFMICTSVSSESSEEKAGVTS